MSHTFIGLPFEPLTLHKYLYASNNPVLFVDPSGRQFNLASQMTAIAISTSLVSLFLPRTYDPYMGYTNEFLLSFEGGGSAGYVLYGGSLDAKIRAFDEQRRTLWVGYYSVFLIGFGGGGGFVEFSGYHRFQSHRPRNHTDFEGFGRITMGEIGIGRPSLGMGGILLPSGDYKEVYPGLSLGLSEGASIYITLAYWDFLYFLPE